MMLIASADSVNSSNNQLGYSLLIQNKTILYIQHKMYVEIKKNVILTFETGCTQVPIDSKPA